MPDKKVGFSHGDAVSIVGADRGEEAELREILIEAGYGPDYIEQQIAAGVQDRVQMAVQYSLSSVIFPEGKTTREQQVAVIAYSVGVPGLPSMSKAGTHFRLNGWSKQVLSWRCKQFCKHAGLRPSIYMKSEKASKIYSKTNRRKTA